MKEIQMSMFGVSPIKQTSYLAFHDESGDDNDRYLLHGVLFVPQAKWRQYLNLLSLWRNGFTGRIHFKKIRDHKLGSFNAARTWLTNYFQVLSKDCYFKCFVVDRHSPAYDPSRLEKSYQEYNLFAGIAFYSGITWFFKSYDELSLEIYSEERSRTEDDNFTEYIPRKLIYKTSSNSKCPNLKLKSPIITLSGDPEKIAPEFAGHCEFLQMTDILTSAVAESIIAGATKLIKIELAKLVAEKVLDVRKLPWEQDKDLHRRFSISCFPDAQGGFYDCNLAVTQSKEQLPLNLPNC